MGIRINTNVPSLTAQRAGKAAGRDLTNIYSHLSSGDRITKSADDAAGLAISEHFKGQIKGLAQAGRNAQDAISLVQVAEGGLVETGNSLIRMRELAIQAASDNIGDEERGYLNLEYQQLMQEIQRTAETTRFGSVSLLDGSGEMMEFQVGLNNNEFQDRIGFNAGEVNAQIGNIGVDGTSIESKDSARESLGNLDTATQNVAGYRAHFGSLQSRLQSTVSVTEIAHENLSAANSRIRDADYAEESGKLTSDTIRQQAAMSVLTQANNTNAVALKLIG